MSLQCEAAWVTVRHPFALKPTNSSGSSSSATTVPQPPRSPDTQRSAGPVSPHTHTRRAPPRSGASYCGRWVEPVWTALCLRCALDVFGGARGGVCACCSMRSAAAACALLLQHALCCCSMRSAQLDTRPATRCNTLQPPQPLAPISTCQMQDADALREFADLERVMHLERAEELEVELDEVRGGRCEVHAGCEVHAAMQVGSAG